MFTSSIILLLYFLRPTLILMTSSTGSDVCGTQNDAKKIQIQIIPIKKEFTRTMPQQSNAFSYESIFRFADSTFLSLHVFTSHYFIIFSHLETIGYNVYVCKCLFHIGKGSLQSSVERSHKCRNWLFPISLIFRRSVL